jgi:amino acid adenylation domain-containing protein
LVDLLRWRAAHQPDRRAYTFLVDGEADAVHLTYADIDRQARSIAALLQSRGMAGERALLLYPPGLDYIAAFFGCLYAQVVAVPAYPPNPAQLERSLPRLRAIARDARPCVALTTSPILSMTPLLAAQDPAFQDLPWLATDAVAPAVAETWHDPAAPSTALAFLQYTSGSTAAPKGVMLTHANLLHNSALIHHAFAHTPASQGVIWLPPYHDMGLIGGVLQPLYGGFPVILMSPVSFLQRPLRWLQAISRYGGTTSGGPNFAYDLCVRKSTPEQRTTLDLSSWRVAFNGAEPIHPDTLERFAAAFAPCGFRREAFYPCYGLAEATLIVTGGRAGAPPVVRRFQVDALAHNRAIAAVAAAQAPDRALIGCGQVLLDQQIAIIEPQTALRCAPEQIGEIWVSGPSVAQGYWDQPEQTEGVFHASIAGADRADRFLRTGDLGFVQDGELFVTGRLKDLIIIRGRNHFPQDIELTVEQSHHALRAGFGAACAVDVAGAERLVVVQEVEARHSNVDVNQVAAAIRQAVADQHELQVYAVVLLKPGSIPKTSSGKIQRHLCRAGFLDGSLAIIGSSILEESTAEWTATALDQAALLALAADARQPALAAYLQEQVARVLQVAPSQVDRDQPVHTLGLDSLMAVELQHAVETDLGVVISMVQFLQGFTIAQIADAALAQLTLARPATPLTAAQDDGEHPLSYGQRALWFLHRLAPESSAYNIPIAVRVRGELDIPALRRAFDRIAQRHPALRTTFVARGELAQQIHATGRLAFQSEDASGWSQQTLHARLVAVAHQPFDLEQGPLLRVHVCTSSAQEHVLLLVAHHIVADLWSLVVLANELNLLYPAEQSGTAATLAPLPIQYTDWVRWQNELLAGPEGERLWSYWRSQLAGALPALDLPTDRPRPPVQTYQGAAHAFTLDAELAHQLKALAQGAGTTLYTAILAAFQTLLYRYSGQADILVGCATTGRNRAELADIVGYFVNLIPMRAKLSGNPPFATFLAQMRQVVLEGFAHQEYPLPLMVERLQPERDPSRSPLFQAVCVLQKAHLLNDVGLTTFALGESGAQMQLGGLTLESIALEQRDAQFELTLMLAEAERGIAGSLQYNADLFDAATIARMAGHLGMLLAGICADPRQRIGDLALLTEGERRQVLVSWNNSRAAVPQQRVHELFEAQAERLPDQVALVLRDAHLTYGGLDRRANQLAHYLRGLGVAPEVRVGLCVERSLDMIVGILGILKAGGAYVPLDPQYPQDRLAFMLDDSQARVLITTQDDRRRTTDDGQMQPIVVPLSSFVGNVVDLRAGWPQIDRMPAARLTNLALAENNVYVIYTSGSTGRPKGVMVKHHGLANLCAGLAAFFDDAAVQQVALITSISFDISVNQIFPTLVFGRTLHIIPDAIKYNSQSLIAYIDERHIHLIDCVPSYLNAVLTDIRADRISNSLRYILIGGEKLEPRLLQKVFGKLGMQVALVNIYGLSEITDINALTAITSADIDTPILIGRPLQNNRIYILNRYGSLQPAGISGELCVAGESLSRGYVHRPDLTAEKFVVCPFGDDTGALMCKTGDVGRWLPNGMIQLFGRIDQQVKVRGFRIEVGEIELVLEQHPAVREAVVVAREDTPDEQRLVAYFVPHDAQTLSVAELRRFLQLKLPEYMIPAIFMAQTELPHTPNGKVDRKALPVPDQTRPALESTFVAPRTRAEEQLATIWSEVLRVEQVGIHDNFFDLGGHSLLATQLVSRMSETFAVEIPLRSLFEAPTVADLALVIAQNRSEQVDQATLAQLLLELNQLSEEEARALLATEPE